MKQNKSPRQWEIIFQDSWPTFTQYKKIVQASNLDNAKTTVRLQFPELKSFSIVSTTRVDVTWKQLYKQWLVGGELPPETEREKGNARTSFIS